MALRQVQRHYRPLNTLSTLHARPCTPRKSFVIRNAILTTSARHTSTQNPANSAGTPTDTSSNHAEAVAALLASNKAWAAHTHSTQPELLPKLSKGQSPATLWLGCSDSRVPETTILGLAPGEVFTHRNIANIITATDLSSLSVIEYAVVYLKVSRIVVCGHTSCGGVAAALGNDRLGKIDAWLAPLRQLRLRHAADLDKCGSAHERGAWLVDANVRQSVEVVRQNPDVIRAAKERGLQVFGFVYDLASGELKEVDCKEEEDAVHKRASAFHIE